MSADAPPPDAVPIEINGQIQDPKDGYAKDAEHTDYIIITVYNILSIAEEDELLELQVGILEDLGENNFLCYYPLHDLAPIREKKFIRQVDVYRNKFKIPAELRAALEELDAEKSKPGGDDHEGPAAAPDTDTCTVDILTHDDITDEKFEDLKAFIVRTTKIPLEDMEFAPGTIRLSLTLDQLIEVASDERVRIVEEVSQVSLMSDDSRNLVGGSVTIRGTAFRGKGQIITVSDTGFDKGSAEDCHPAFSGKVLALTPISRVKSTKLSEQQKADDPQGHGTHVSGIILGQDFDTSVGLVGGIAPDAKLIVQSLYQDSLNPVVLPVDITTLFSVPYAQGSRIFSNSWGTGLIKKDQQPDYAEPAKVIDNFINDNPDAFVCFSAGNDNNKANGKPAIGIHAGAKNVLTVGASGNSAAPEAMYDRSSFGPTKEQRLKPDVIAPGVDIYSALSRGAKFFGQAATKEGVDGRWKQLSGTSQATPLVAGCAAVLREILQSEGCANPPAALLKAVIINGADKLPGIETNAQGHGRVNLQASSAIAHVAPALSKDNSIENPLPISGGTLIGASLKQDEEYEFTLSAPDESATTGTHFKITMVYNDIGNKQIQNNLNLFVTDVDKNETKPGNEKSVVDPDLQNNVEQIVLSPLPSKGLRVKVHAQKILARKDQDYALAWSVFTPLPNAVV